MWGVGMERNSVAVWFGSLACWRVDSAVTGGCRGGCWDVEGEKGIVSKREEGGKT